MLASSANWFFDKRTTAARALTHNHGKATVSPQPEPFYEINLTFKINKSCLLLYVFFSLQGRERERDRESVYLSLLLLLLLISNKLITG